MTLCLGPRSVQPKREADPIAGPPRFSHVKCAPSPALAPFVEHYWLTRWDRRAHPPRIASSLLDPCVHLQLRNGHAELMGVVRGAYRMTIEGAGCIVGVKFRAGGFYPFVRRPVIDWTDQVVSAATVFDGMIEVRSHSERSSTDALVCALSNAVAACTGEADEHAAMIGTHLDAFLEDRLPARDPTAEEMGALVVQIADNSEIRRMSDLITGSGRSGRTLHRLFARYVGVSPAWVIRRYRLQAAAERLTKFPSTDVGAVAGEFGYADQAHFTRDFRATIGVTPGAYVQAPRANS